MNDSTNQETLRLKRLLEEVTAADTPAGDAAAQCPDAARVRDVEGESLRQTWLAFSQLIRAADASLPAMAPVVLPMAAPLRPQKSRPSRWVALIAAAAAILLVAVTFGWLTGGAGVSPVNRGAAVSPAKDSSETPSPTNNTNLAKQDRRESTTPTEIATTGQPTTGQPTTGQPTTGQPTTGQPTAEQPRAVAAKASTWDDPLDTQIVTVSQEIRDVQQNWERGVDDVDLVRYRMDEVSDSLQNDSL